MPVSGLTTKFGAIRSSPILRPSGTTSWARCPACAASSPRGRRSDRSVAFERIWCAARPSTARQVPPGCHGEAKPCEQPVLKVAYGPNSRDSVSPTKRLSVRHRHGWRPISGLPVLP